MRRLRRPVGKLSWRLALSYILVTLVVAVLIEAVNIVATIATEPSNQPSNPAYYFARDLENLVAPQLPPYLEQNPPDRQGLAAWITTLMYPASHPQGKNPQATRAGCCFSPNFALVAVLGADGQVLASASATGTPNPGDLNAPPAQMVIHAALAGNKTSTDQTSTLADGRTVVAVPVLIQDGQHVLGVLFTIPAGQVLTDTSSPSKPSDTLATILATLSPGALYFMLLACVVGTLSGLWASRGITRRLRQITQAASAWSQGEFQVEVRDTSPDEIGHLARDLNTMAEQLQALLTTRQELAVVEERHRLARDLHDSVKQQLFVMTMLVGAARALVLDHPQAEQTLSEAERLAGQTHQELNALIRALRPVALAGKGLSAALHELIKEWSQSTGITAETDLPTALLLPLEAEQALFRVAQEALNNVARHSGARAIQIRLVREPESVRLQIQDNGHGFDVARHNDQGLGLGSMRERVETLGGTLLVFSTTEGTRVEARVPVMSSTAASLPEEASSHVLPT